MVIKSKVGCSLPKGNNTNRTSRAHLPATVPRFALSSGLLILPWPPPKHAFLSKASIPPSIQV